MLERRVRLPHLIAGALVSLGAMHGVAAQAPGTGERIYRETCSACHATGEAGAPKFGDRAAWKGRVAAGQPVATARAWVGFGWMPPKGGRADLALADFARAAAFMARAGGGSWSDPDAKAIAKIVAEEKRLRAKKK